METIGLIGVGYIGTEFLDRLLEDGREVVVHDVDDGAVERARDRGASADDGPAAVARRTDAVVLALPGTPEVEAVLTGSAIDDAVSAGGASGGMADDGTADGGTDAQDEGLLAALEEGQLVVDATTTRPATSVATAERCSAAGVDFLEAPITGGAPREGYQMMVGGTEARYAAATSLLDVLADAHVRVGETPAGTVLKLGLQARYAGRAALDAEIVEYLRDSGVDPALLRNFLAMDVWERYLSREFAQGIEGLGGLAIWHKDLGYLREFARDRGTALPLTGVVHEAYKATTRRAGPEEGHAAALLGYWELLNDRGGRQG